MFFLKSLLWLIVIACSACSYRIATPFQMPQGIHIQITENQSRLVQSQTFINQALAVELHRELGWDINNQSNNLLSVKIKADDIKESARDSEKISVRWRNTLHADVELFCPYVANGKITKSFSASASNSSLADESASVREASEILAQHIRTWLMDQEYTRLPSAK